MDLYGVYLAYISSKEDFKACYVKAHEVRILASSCSLFDNGIFAKIT